MKTDTETGGRQPHSMDSRNLLEPEGRKDSPPEPSEGAGSCQHLDFRLAASRTATEHISVLCIQPGDSDWLGQPQELTQREEATC